MSAHSRHDVVTLCRVDPLWAVLDHYQGKSCPWRLPSMCEIYESRQKWCEVWPEGYENFLSLPCCLISASGPVRRLISHTVSCRYRTELTVLMAVMDVPYRNGQTVAGSVYHAYGVHNGELWLRNRLPPMRLLVPHSKRPAGIPCFLEPCAEDDTFSWRKRLID